MRNINYTKNLNSTKDKLPKKCTGLKPLKVCKVKSKIAQSLWDILTLLKPLMSG